MIGFQVSEAELRNGLMLAAALQPLDLRQGADVDAFALFVAVVVGGHRTESELRQGLRWALEIRAQLASGAMTTERFHALLDAGPGVAIDHFAKLSPDDVAAWTARAS